MKLLNETDKHVYIQEKNEEAILAGKILLSENKVSLIILSGGQGTRLNFKGPKLLFPLPPFGTIFEIFYKKIQIFEKKYKVKAKIFILTSEFTHDEIKKYIDLNFKDLQITLFQQDSEDCIDMCGNSFSSINGNVKAPNGNGGVFKALRNIELKNSDIFQIVSVDNVLVNIFDPLPIGIVAQNNYDVFSKAVKKNENENAGVFVMENENIHVAEYSEHSFRGNSYANICNHYFSSEFLEKMKNKKLEAHFAHKKINYFEKGKFVTPKTPNGFKKEYFIFDALKYTQNSGVLIVDRKLEFSALKNGLESNFDNMLTCVEDLEKCNFLMSN